MPQVNYIREMEHFIVYAGDEKLTSGERLVWYALMHVMNQAAHGNLWPEEFVRISNERLLSLCPMKFETMAAARNKLKQRGLIDFIPGDKKKRSPAYKVIYFFPVYAEKSDKTGDYQGDNAADNCGDYPGNNQGDVINKRYGEEKQGNQTGEITSDEDEEAAREDAQVAAAQAEAAESWVEYFGRPPTEAASSAIAIAGALTFGFGPGVISTAVRLAAIKNAESPVNYILELFRDWGHYGVHSREDVSVYLYWRNAACGRHGPDAQAQARAELDKLAGKKAGKGGQA